MRLPRPARPLLTLILLAGQAGCAAGAADGGQPAAPPERTEDQSLRGRVIVVDPGHGGTAATDSYRVGPTGEREEWVNLRVALLLRDLLEQRGARVVLTREHDLEVGLQARAELARDVAADAFVSLHHNATADPTANFPVVYYHGYASANPAGVRLARHLARRLNAALFADSAEAVVVSDHVIFAGAGTAVLRHSYGIPGVIGEASYFTNPHEEARLRDPAHNRREAEAYALALEDFFADPVPAIHPKDGTDAIEPFRAAQESERMAEVARRWRQDYVQGRALLRQPRPDLGRAYELLTRSVRSFPDSPVARDAHRLRADIRALQGRHDEARATRRRVAEFYPGP